MMKLCGAVAVCVVSGLCSLAAAAEPAGGNGATILDTSGYWRNHFTIVPPVARDGAELKKLPTVSGETPPPPKDWAAPEFDDSNWARTPGRPLPCAQPEVRTTPIAEFLEAGIGNSEMTSPALAMLCMRGKFSVTDLAAAKGLKLSLRYRGGVVVYLNGKEVGRAGIAKDASGPGALADDYPKEAFFREDGTPCRGEDLKNPTAEVAAWKARVRQAEISIPADALRKGVNVLALELHRTAYPAEVPKWTTANMGGWSTTSAAWSTCGLLAARLTADSPAGLTPNASRPQGFQVWNSQALQPDYDVDYGDSNEPLRPIRLVGTPGGVFSGKVVAGSDQPIKGLKAQISDLTSAKGGKIAATAVKVRYGMPTGWEPVVPGRYPVLADLMDGLLDSPPAVVEVRADKKKVRAELIPPGQPDWIFGAVCPVWVTVAVPDDAAPGDYSGKLTISADGQKSVEVPVELSVSSYRLPKPNTFHTFVDLIQSPESVALQYDVPLYSEKHWQLVAKSLDRLGHIGNWTLHVPLICQSNQGNEQSMVRWVKKADGTYKYDFTVFDKYLDLAEQHMGKPRILNLVVWDKFLGSTLDGHAGIKASVGEVEDVPVSTIDSDGKVSMITVGRYDEKAKPQWQALVAELKARLKKRGLENAAVLGTAMDCYPAKEVIDFWESVWPEVSWSRYSHIESGTIPGTKKRWGFESGMSLHGILPDPTNPKAKPAYGWNRPDNNFLFFRLNYVRKWIPWISLPWDTSRLLGEMVTQGPKRGFGRMGLDFWPVIKNAKGEPAANLVARYPKSSWLQLDAMIKCWVPPGPDGAMATGKLEMMREGLQENEARIFIESKLLDEAAKAKLPPALVEKCQKVIADRTKALSVNLERLGDAGFRKLYPYLDGYSTGNYDGTEAGIFRQWYMESGWQERSRALYDLAAEVEKALK